jgi:hypothetical protein
VKENLTEVRDERGNPADKPEILDDVFNFTEDLFIFTMNRTIGPVSTPFVNRLEFLQGGMAC